MRDLERFYKMKWRKNTPRIMVVNDRKTIDALKGEKTESWLVGWTNRRNDLFVLNLKNFSKESRHRYSKEQYRALIKHELSHLFIHALAQDNHRYRPIWLHEGIAVYTAGQTKFKKKPLKFHEFLKFYSRSSSGVYQEAGFFIELLVKNFGKNKLLRLVKSLKYISSKKQFEATFRRIFGFKLNYGAVNKLFKSLKIA